MRVIARGQTGLRELLRAPGLDVALALAAFAALLIDPLVSHKVSALTPVMGILGFLTAVPLVLRRRFPLGALAVEMPLLLACLAVFRPAHAAVGIAMLLVFTVGLEGGRTRSLVVGLLMAVLVSLAVLVTGQRTGPGDYVAYTALVVGALLVGETLRVRRALAAEAARAREAAARHRFDEERLALAHEVHDIVGHTLVGINVRAAAAARRARKRGAADETAVLDEIAAASAGALTELRTTLKALRAAQDGAAPLHPRQDLANLGELVDGVGEAGLSVELTVTGSVAGLPASLSHAGYRIVQEGLTNVLRHSTARRARVVVEARERGLTVEVVDDGEQRPDATAAAGHGLQGMRERAATLGGSCEAGPVDGAGWRVRAELPVRGEGSS